MSHHKPHHNYSWPLFENMPSLGDEAVWDLLEMLYGLIDAYEEHYADALHRLRQQRYEELHETCIDERQLKLPINDGIDDPF